MKNENFEKDKMEVEKKFLVKKNSFNFDSVENLVDRIVMYQAYFVDEDGKYKRVRLQESIVTGEKKTVICEKIVKGYINNVPLMKEIEEDFPYSYGINIIKNKNLFPIKKERVVIPFHKYFMEIDKFENLSGEFENLVTAEVEFKSEQSLLDFDNYILPNFIEKELTGDKSYSNASLSKMVDKSKVFDFEKPSGIKLN